MVPAHRIPPHPGKILQENFLAPRGISQVQLAEHLGIPVHRVREIIRRKRGISPDMAWLLGKALRTPPEFWMNLQSAYDLAQARPHRPIRPLGAVRFGVLKGQISIAADFDAPLPQDVLKLFKG